MKIVVIGGSGLIGSQLIEKLDEAGHEAVNASPQTGVNTLTGEGLADIMRGAAVVVDVSNSPSFEDQAVMEFFTTSTANQLEAERAAGVGHHVALSIVGTDTLPDSGYLRAKHAQEQAIQDGPTPYTILRSTQFFEFVRRIADEAFDGEVIRLPTALMQPVATVDVVTGLAALAQGSPRNAVVEIAGPESFPLDELARQVLRANDDPRPVEGDPHATYFGTELADSSLRPGPDARIGHLTLADWLAQTARSVLT
jgi:uncharacterized protein YbjT (DUF2867 family)